MIKRYKFEMVAVYMLDVEARCREDAEAIAFDRIRSDAPDICDWCIDADLIEVEDLHG